MSYIFNSIYRTQSGRIPANQEEIIDMLPGINDLPPTYQEAIRSGI